MLLGKVCWETQPELLGFVSHLHSWSGWIGKRMLLQQWMQWAVYWTWLWDIIVLVDEKRHSVKRFCGVCGWVAVL